MGCIISRQLTEIKNHSPRNKKIYFTLKRTKKPLSRLPVDLTLKQTINADAASQRIGIIAITNSISTRQR